MARRKLVTYADLDAMSIAEAKATLKVAPDGDHVVKAHPLDIPSFLIAKGRAVRDEAEIARVCARAATLRHTDQVDEEHDPRLLEAVKRGVISRSVLRDPSSIAVAMNAIAPVRVERVAKAAPDAAEAPKRVARPDDHVTAQAIALALEIDAKLLRRALRSLEVEKPAHGWAFAPSAVPALTKKIKVWLKVQEKRS